MDHSAHSHHIQASSDDEAHSHEGHAHHHHGDFKQRFWINTALTVPVLFLSHMIQDMLGLHFEFAYSRHLLFALASIIFLYGGWPFFTGFISEIKKLRPGMMTLIAIAITVSYLYSTAVAFGLHGMDFYWELATLIDVMLLGHWFEMRSVTAASGSLHMLAGLLPSSAHVLHGDHVMEIPISELTPGMHVLVKPGEKIPADGEIFEGSTYLDESMLTGESKPVAKTPGHQAIAGAVNGNGSLKIKVTHTGKESYLSRVVALVDEAQKTKSHTQQLADRAAFWLTIFALTAGCLTLVVWLSLGSPVAFAIERMVTVMVISCPHALGLAVPLVASISTTLAARHGFLIRNRTAFENARKISTVIFDKTGTLTEGKFGVTRIQSFSSSLDENTILLYAASLEQNSEHPIASGLLSQAKQRKLGLLNVQNFQAHTGQGISGTINGKHLMLVSPRYLEEKQIRLPGTLQSGVATTIILLIDNTAAAAVMLADTIRPQAKDAIDTLHRHGIKSVMLTGDVKEVAADVSATLGLNSFYAGLLPHQKQEKIKELQAHGEFVAMTGDGVNDAPALAQANVGIAVASGTDVAAATADIILVRSDPRDVSEVILFGRATYRKMIQNLVWATAYNAITLPLATGFIGGITISPAVGALFMSLSTIVVAVNAQFLRKQIH